MLMNCRASIPAALVSLFCCAALARAATNTNATARAGAATNAPALKTDAPAAKPKFTKQQVASRLRQLKELYERGLLTQEFYERKVEECQPGDSAAPAAPAAPAVPAPKKSQSN